MIPFEMGLKFFIGMLFSVLGMDCKELQAPIEELQSIWFQGLSIQKIMFLYSHSVSRE